MEPRSYRQWLASMLVVAAACLVLKYVVLPWAMPAKPVCTILRSETVKQNELLSEIALREIKAQEADWPQSISFNHLIANVTFSIQSASRLNSSTPSAGTVIQIPDLHDPDC